jgi:hypothetical protein
MNARHVYPGTSVGKKSPRIEDHERLRTANLSWLEHICGSLAQSPICQGNFLLKLNAISLDNVFGY